MTKYILKTEVTPEQIESYGLPFEPIRDKGVYLIDVENEQRKEDNLTIEEAKCYFKYYNEKGEVFNGKLFPKDFNKLFILDKS
jgi:hypothetical protein